MPSKGGEAAERTNAAASKAVMPVIYWHRGFESTPLRWLVACAGPRVQGDRYISARALHAAPTTSIATPRALTGEFDTAVSSLGITLEVIGTAGSRFSMAH